MNEAFNDPYFSAKIPRMLSMPVLGRVEFCRGLSPRIKFGGTSWSWKFHEHTLPVSLVDGQEVAIMGLIGNTLLISVSEG